MRKKEQISNDRLALFSKLLLFREKKNDLIEKGWEWKQILQKWAKKHNLIFVIYELGVSPYKRKKLVIELSFFLYSVFI